MPDTAELRRELTELGNRVHDWEDYGPVRWCQACGALHVKETDLMSTYVGGLANICGADERSAILQAHGVEDF